MATYETGELVNQLTAFDTAFHAKWHNLLTVYPSDEDGREAIIPASFVGIDDEWSDPAFPSWKISVAPVVFDVRRYSEEKVRTVVDAENVTLSDPPEPNLIIYVVNGYSQDARIFKEMQLFAKRTFPRHAYITVGGNTCYVDRGAEVVDIDRMERQYVLQITYEVWALLELEVSSDEKRVFNTITVGYTIGQGRNVLLDAYEEEQEIT